MSSMKPGSNRAWGVGTVLREQLAEAAPPPQQSGFRRLLRQQDFRLIWFAQLSGQLADKFLMFSLIILAYGISHGSTTVAITLLAYLVPSVVISPLGGVFADRHDRKLIMVVTNFVRGALIALIPLAALVPALRHDYVHLLLITFAFSAVGQLFSPAEAAAIPAVVDRRHLITANSMVLGTMVVTLVLGAALAPIASRFDIYAPYWISVVLFGLAGSLVLCARIPRPQRRGPTHRHAFHQLLIEVRDGWAALHSSRVLTVAFYELSLAVLVMFVMFTLAPAYVNQVLGIQEQDSYVILLPATVGALISAGLISNFSRRLGPARFLISGLASTGVTLCALAVVPMLLRQAGFQGDLEWFGIVFSLAFGVEFGMLMIPALYYLMGHTSDHFRGRIFSLLFMVVNGASALPVLLSAALADWIGITKVVAAMGMILVLGAILTIRFGRRTLAESSQPD
jgi:MFS family permease